MGNAGQRKWELLLFLIRTEVKEHQTARGQRDSPAACGCVTLFEIFCFSEAHENHRAAMRNKWDKEGTRGL